MTNLKSADLSKTAVTEISNYAFSQCSALENVIFPSALTVIGGGAFAGCTGIKDIEFPESLTSIGQY
ncbi:surface protein, partial [Rhizobium sp. KAs_5_22]